MSVSTCGRRPRRGTLLHHPNTHLPLPPPPAQTNHLFHPSTMVLSLPPPLPASLPSPCPRVMRPPTFESRPWKLPRSTSAYTSFHHHHNKGIIDRFRGWRQPSLTPPSPRVSSAPRYPLDISHPPPSVFLSSTVSQDHNCRPQIHIHGHDVAPKMEDQKSNLAVNKQPCSKDDDVNATPITITTKSQGQQTHPKEKTPMCLVNELARYNKVQHRYSLKDESGPAHRKAFTVCLQFIKEEDVEEEEEYVATGPSIKKAQHAAAALALHKTNLKHPPTKQQLLPYCGSKKKAANNVSSAAQFRLPPTVELNTWVMRCGLTATYSFVKDDNLDKKSFLVNLKVGGDEFVGEGVTAQAAKHCAASKALKILKSSSLKAICKPFFPSGVDQVYKSPVSHLHESALKRNTKVIFEILEERGPPHMRTFTTKCTLGDFTTLGQGHCKKMSKKQSAELMLSKLATLPPVASCNPLISLPATANQKSSKRRKKSIINSVTKNKDDATALNPISRLIQIQQAKKAKGPVYDVVAERGVARKREYVVRVSIGDVKAESSGPNKKVAKRLAAQSLLQLLGYSSTRMPGKPVLKKSHPHEDVKEVVVTKKLTFVDDPKEENVVATSDMDSTTVSCFSFKWCVCVFFFFEDFSDSSLEAGSDTPNDVVQRILSPKEELDFLSKALDFKVTYTTFQSNNNNVVTLVKLETRPPKVCHGSGPTLELSQSDAASRALVLIADSGGGGGGGGDLQASSNQSINQK